MPRDLILRVSEIRSLSNEYLKELLKEYGIDDLLPSHGALFSALKDSDEGLGISGIARHMGRSKSTVSVMVKGLEKKGYLISLQAPDNSLEKRVKTTEKFRSLKDTFEEISQKLLSRVYGDMPVEKRRLLSELLKEIKTNLGTYK